MKESENTEFQNNEDLEVEEDLIKIDKMLIEVNKRKEEGNKLVLEKKYKEAEKIYLDSLEIMNKFETKKKFEMNTEQKKEKAKEIMDTMKNLYSNLSLCQGKQFRLQEAIETSTYILTNFDHNHDKSYIRIMMWLIEINELGAAEEIQKEIKNKFFGEKLKVFNSAFNLLKIKKEEAEKKLKNKIKNSKNNDLIEKNDNKEKDEIIKEENNFYKFFNKYKYITLGVGGILGVISIFLLYKYKNK